MLQAPPLKYGRIYWSGNGFTCNSHTRAPPDVVKANLEPAGSLSIQPRRDWWEAQVRLYGIQCLTWTVEGMKTALKQQLKSGQLRVTEKMERSEEAYNKKYHAENKALQVRASNRESYHRCSPTEIQSYTDDPSRLFWELKQLGGVKGLSLEWRRRKTIHKEAERQSCFSKTALGNILLVGAHKKDVVLEWNKITHEASAQRQDLIAKQKQEQIAEQLELDRLHAETIQTGNTDIAGKWVLDTNWGFGKQSCSVSIASPCDGSMWMTGEREVWHLDWIALDSEEKTFEWTKTDGVDGYEFDYDSHKGTGTITFVSPYSLKGESHRGDFTGRKVGNEISATNEACIAKCEKATKDILEMKDKWDYCISSGMSKKEIMNELYST